MQVIATSIWHLVSWMWEQAGYCYQYLTPCQLNVITCRLLLPVSDTLSAECDNMHVIATSIWHLVSWMWEQAGYCYQYLTPCQLNVITCRLLLPVPDTLSTKCDNMQVIAASIWHLVSWMWEQAGYCYRYLTPCQLNVITCRLLLPVSDAMSASMSALAHWLLADCFPWQLHYTGGFAQARIKNHKTTIK